MKRIIYVVTVLFLILSPLTGFAENVKESASKNFAKYGMGYRYNVGGWIYLHIEGEPYERGYQHGFLLADEIVDVIERWRNVFPQKRSWDLQKKTAMRLFWNKYPDEYKEEIKGIADGVADAGGVIDGSPVNHEDILTLNEMYELLSRFRTYLIHPVRSSLKWLLSNFFKTGFSQTPHMGHCSAFIATGEATADGGVVASHSTWRANEETWFPTYVTERWNVILDITPSSGYRIMMTTSPGLIWSDEDFYQNDAGMILMETTLSPLGAWTKRGDPVVVRVRKAIQYSDNIDEIVECLLKNNNGLMANDWVMGDTKTGEIASLELALHHHGLRRTKNGFIYSCNNVKDDKVRWELNSLFGFGVTGRILKKDFKPSPRDIKFLELKDKYYGRIDVDVAKRMMSTSPISDGSFDCKITDSRLVRDFGLWAFMGNPTGEDFLAAEHPFKKTKPGYTDLPACGWVLLYALSPQNMYQPGLERNHVIDGKQGRMLWSFETKNTGYGNAVYSTPVVQEKIMYLTSWNGDAYAVDINTGGILWNTTVGGSSSSSPAVSEKKVFVGSNNGLYALDKKTGRVAWRREIDAVSSNPVFYNNRVFCGSVDGKIHVFNSTDGSIEWDFKTNGAIHSSPLVYNNAVYIGSADGTLYVINVKTGEVKWVYKTGGPICSTPCIHGDIVYFGSWDNNLYALDCKTGEVKWRFTTGWGVVSSPAVWNNIVYFGGMDNNFYAVDASSGELKWSFPCKAAIRSSPTVYGGFVFFGCDDGRVYALNASTGQLIWSYAPSYHIEENVYSYVTKPIVSSPYAYDGKIVVGSTDGNIYVFDAQTWEKKTMGVEKVKVPIETWFFLVIPLLFIVSVTAIYLYKKRGGKE